MVGALPSSKISGNADHRDLVAIAALAREFLRRRFLNEITFGPRLCSSTSAATEAPETVGAPAPASPTSKTSPSCTIVPTSPAILPI